jgi:hypothetical protein
LLLKEEVLLREGALLGVVEKQEAPLLAQGIDST